MRTVVLWLGLAVLAAAQAAVTIPAGTRLEMELPQTTRLHGVGQKITAVLTQPVYAQDRLALPVGTKMLGAVIAVRGPSWGTRATAGMGGDFSPSPAVQVRFSAVELADGSALAIQSAPAPERPELRLVAGGAAGGRAASFELAISQAYHQDEDNFEALLRAQTHWDSVKQEFVTSLPYRPAQLPAGASFAARLTTPVTLATAPGAPALSPEARGNLPAGLKLHARLDQNLSSATAHWGEPVSATLDQPALDAAGRLVVPEGARLTGSVVEVHPARRWGRGGRLRFRFTRIELPNGGPVHPVAARLAAAAVSGAVTLGGEGEARAHAPGGATPYVALSVVMATSLHADADNAWSLNAGSGTRLRLWGAALAMVSTRWQPIGLVFGFAGSGRTIYRHWIGRGPEMVFAQDTALVIQVQKAGKHGATLP